MIHTVQTIETQVCDSTRVGSQGKVISIKILLLNAHSLGSLFCSKTFKNPSVFKPGANKNWRNDLSWKPDCGTKNKLREIFDLQLSALNNSSLLLLISLSVRWDSHKKLPLFFFICCTWPRVACADLWYLSGLQCLHPVKLLNLSFRCYNILHCYSSESLKKHIPGGSCSQKECEGHSRPLC